MLSNIEDEGPSITLSSALFPYTQVFVVQTDQKKKISGLQSLKLPANIQAINICQVLTVGQWGKGYSAAPSASLTAPLQVVCWAGLLVQTQNLFEPLRCILYQNILLLYSETFKQIIDCKFAPACNFNYLHQHKEKAQ